MPRYIYIYIYRYVKFSLNCLSKLQTQCPFDIQTERGGRGFWAEKWRSLNMIWMLWGELSEAEQAGNQGGYGLTNWEDKIATF